MSDRIKVGVKVRPLINREFRDKSSIHWKVLRNNAICQLDPSSGKEGTVYEYDYVFGLDSSNEEIFETLAKPIVEASLKGFNGTVFAYGQTSSGKTYTMMGNVYDQGIIPRSIQYIFELIEKTPNREFLIRVCFLEIYNEKVYDLLNNRSDEVKISEDMSGNVLVKHAHELVASSAQMVLDFMKAGQEWRSVGETRMNENSSRSHCIFRIILESRDCTSGDPDEAVQVSHLNFVDLAGSERISSTGATGDRLKEGRSINLSLLMLGKVIQQLSDGESHVNFRDSKLTRILQSSLGGNALTAFVCAVTPASIDETNSTLGFAKRVGNVKNSAKINEVVSDAALLKRYMRQIKKLQSEVNEMKGQKTNEKLVSELEQKNSELHARIERLRSYIVFSSDCVSHSDEKNQVKSRKLRRQTWSAPNRCIPRLSLAPPRSKCLPTNFDLTIEENSLSLSPLNGVARTASLDDSAFFTTPLEDFERELILAERSHFVDANNSGVLLQDDMETKQDDIAEESSSFSSLSGCFIQTRKPRHNRCRELASTDGKVTVDTPPEKLRYRAQLAKEEFEELRQFTQLEKQIYNEQAEEEMKSLKADLQESKAHINKLEKELEALRSQDPTTFDFQSLLLDANKKCSILQEENRSLSDKLRDANAKCKILEEIKIALDKAEKQLKSLTAEKQHLVKSLESNQARLNHLEREKQDFDITMTLMTEKHERKEKELSKSLERAWADIEDLKSHVIPTSNSCDTNNQIRNESFSVSQHSEETLASKVLALEKEVGALVSENADLQHALKTRMHPNPLHLTDHTSRTNIQSQSRLTSFSSALTDLEEEPSLDELVQEVNSLRKEKSQLIEESNTLIEEKENLMQEIISQSSHIRKYEEEMEEAHSTLNNKLKMIESLQTALQDLGQQVEQKNHLSTDSLKETELQLKSMEAENEKLVSEVCILSSEKDELKQKLLHAQEMMKHLQTEDPSTSHKVETCKEDIQSNCNEVTNVIQSLSVDEDHLLKLTIDLKEKLRIGEEECHLMQQELKSLTEEKENLTALSQCMKDQIEETRLFIENQKKLHAELLHMKEENTKKLQSESLLSTTGDRECPSPASSKVTTPKPLGLLSLALDTQSPETMLDITSNDPHHASNVSELHFADSSQQENTTFDDRASSKAVDFETKAPCSDENEEMHVFNSLKSADMNTSVNNFLDLSTYAEKILEGYADASTELTPTFCHSCESALAPIQEENRRLKSLAVEKSKESDQFRELSDELRRDVLDLKNKLMSAFHQNDAQEVTNDQSKESGNSSMCDDGDLEVEVEIFSDDGKPVSQMCMDLKCEAQGMKLDPKLKDVGFGTALEQNTQHDDHLKASLISYEVAALVDHESPEALKAEIISKKEQIAELEQNKMLIQEQIEIGEASLASVHRELESHSLEVAEQKAQFDCDLKRIKEENVRLNKELENLMTACLSKDKSILELQKYKTDIQEELTKLQNVCSSKENLILELQKMKTDIQDELTDLQNACSSKDTFILELQRSKADILDKLSDFQDICSSKENSILELQRSKASIQDELADLQNVCSSKENLILELQKSKADIQDELTDLQNACSSKDTLILELQKSQAHIQDQLIDLQNLCSSKENLILELQRSKAPIQDELADLQNVCSSKENLILELQKSKADIQDELTDLQNLCSLKENLILELQNSKTGLEEELTDLQNVCSFKENLILELQKSNANIQDELTDLQNACSSKDTLILELQRSKADILDKLTDFQDMCSSKENTISELQRSKASIQDELADLQNVCSSKENLILELQKSKADIQDELTDLQNACSSKDTLILELQKSQAHIQDQLTDLQNLYSSKENLILELQRSKASIQNELADLQKVCSLQENSIMELEKSKTILQEELYVKETSLANLCQELESFRDKDTEEKRQLDSNDSILQENQLKNLHSLCTTKDEKIVELGKMITLMQEELNLKDECLASLRQDLECLRTKALEKVETDLQPIHEGNLCFQNELRNLKTVRSSKDTVMTEVEGSKDNLLKEIDCQKSSHACLHQTLEKQELKASEQNAQCEKGFKCILEENHHLKDRLNSMTAVCSSKENLILELVKSKDNLQEEINKREISLANLRKELLSLKLEYSQNIAQFERNLHQSHNENLRLQDELEGLKTSCSTKQKFSAEPENIKADNEERFDVEETSHVRLSQELDAVRIEASERILRLKSDLDSMHEEKLHLCSELENLKGECSSKDTIIAALKESNAHQQEEISVLKASLEGLGQELESLRREGSEQKLKFNSDVDSLHQRNCKLLDELKEVKSDCSFKDKLIADLERSKAVMQKEIDVRESSLASLHNDLELLRNEAYAQKAQLESQLQQFREERQLQMSQKSEEIYSITKAKKELENQLVAYSQEIQKLQTQVDSLQTDLDVERGKHSQLSLKYPLTSQFLAPANSVTAKKMEQLRTENLQLKEEMLTLKTELSRLKSALAAGPLCSNCEAAQEEIKRLQINVADKMADIAYLRTVNRTKNQPAERKIALLTQQLSEAQKKCSDLKAENRKLAKACGDVTFRECTLCIGRMKEKKNAATQTDESRLKQAQFSLSGAPSGIVEECTQKDWQIYAHQVEKSRDVYRQLCVKRQETIKSLQKRVNELEEKSQLSKLPSK